MAGPAGTQVGRPFLQSGPGGVHAPGLLYRRLLGGLQVGKALVEVGDPTVLVLQALFQLSQARPQGPGLVGEVPALHLKALEGLGRRREPGIVLVQLAVATGHLVVCITGRPFGEVQRPCGIGMLHLG